MRLWETNRIQFIIDQAGSREQRSEWRQGEWVSISSIMMDTWIRLPHTRVWICNIKAREVLLLRRDPCNVTVSLNGISEVDCIILRTVIAVTAHYLKCIITFEFTPNIWTKCDRPRCSVINKNITIYACAWQFRPIIISLVLISVWISAIYPIAVDGTNREPTFAKAECIPLYCFRGWLNHEIKCIVWWCRR